MKPKSSREEILEAAIAVFADKGFYSTHMEEIAGRAGVNKAMVYYYFGSKEKLLSEVLAVIFSRITENLQGRFFASRRRLPASPVDRIRLFVETHFDVFATHQNYARILVNILSIKPDEIKRLFSENSVVKDIFSEVFKAFEQGRELGLLRDIDYRQLLISILGMNLVYFVTKPVAQVFLQLEVVDERKFIRERRKFVVDLLLHGVLKKTELPEEESR